MYPASFSRPMFSLTARATVDVMTDVRPARAPVFARLSERQWMVLCALAACLITAVLVLTSRVYPHDRGGRLIVALVACVPVLALRRWPLPALALATAAMSFGFASNTVALPFSVVLALAAFLVAFTYPRRVWIRIAGVTGLVLVATFGYAAVKYPYPQVADESILGLLPFAAAWVIGDSAAARRRYLAGLAEQAERERTSEAERARQDIREERVRIARELHDVVAHTLTVITVQAGVGRRLMGKHPEEAGNALASIETIGRTAQDELRVVLGLLRDEPSEVASLTPAPRLTDLKDLVDTVRDSGTAVELRTSQTDRELSPSLELSIYRVVQEALTNVVKHAPGASACVDVTVTDAEIRLEITNEGSAEMPAPVTGYGSAGSRPGHGIVGMRERVGAFGGWLAAGPWRDGGFRVAARIPL